MLGPLPRLHRWVLIGLSALSGAGLGAWVSHWTLHTTGYGCSDMLMGICVLPQVSLLPVLVGTALGLMVALWMVYQPDEPRRLPVDPR
jgi:hypothetical protein